MVMSICIDANWRFWILLSVLPVHLVKSSVGSSMLQTAAVCQAFLINRPCATAAVCMMHAASTLCQ